jgi:hypothetical protein
MGHIKVARWTYYTGNFIDNTDVLCCLWGIFKNRHLSNATGRIRDESLMNLGGRALDKRRKINFDIIYNNKVPDKYGKI